ncbi:unnamed protein product [Cochlearia groenlandica]
MSYTSGDGSDDLIVRTNWRESVRISNFLIPKACAWIKADRIAKASATSADFTKLIEEELSYLLLPLLKIHPRPAEQVLADQVVSVWQEVKSFRTRRHDIIVEGFD